MQASPRPDEDKPPATLRRGWTTGACATAAMAGALTGFIEGVFPAAVTVVLPQGETPTFPLHETRLGLASAMASVVKDAGDDPDVTHGAVIAATVAWGAPGAGVTFKAGEGVGTVTKPGLPIPVGEPAINPVPRRLMTETARRIAAQHGVSPDIAIEIAVPGGEKLAERTWNPRLGIVGGISILGTTGIVIPYSCSAWIHSIQRGIDVARATGLRHVVGCTGSTSEKAAESLLGLGEDAMIDMGDFVGGMLKYLRRHPVEQVTIAGGFAKLSKLAAGHLDLHSKRSQVGMAWLARQVAALGGSAETVRQVEAANTAMAALELAEAQGLPLASSVAMAAKTVAMAVLGDAPIALDVLIFDRQGKLAGRSL
jgi:cobalt-precorrin-5B (C1)-methyltransferase